MENMEFDRSAKVAFDEVADDYDRYRPGYPAEALSAMAALSGIGPGSRILEVGCGTGQATAPLAARGIEIDAVELGSNLAAVAMRKLAPWPRVRVAVGAFEGYEPPAGDYDLVFSAQAFHWVDPSVRLRKSARLLKRDGCLALLYNFTPHPLEGALAVLSDRLQELDGNPLGSPWMSRDIERWRMELSESGLFGDVALFEYPWRRDYDAEAYQGLYRTYSDYHGLSADLRGKAAEIIKRTVDETGGSITRHYACSLIHARKKG
jgi:SAM-dependent methyltransferase